MQRGRVEAFERSKSRQHVTARSCDLGGDSGVRPRALKASPRAIRAQKNLPNKPVYYSTLQQHSRSLPEKTLEPLFSSQRKHKQPSRRRIAALSCLDPGSCVGCAVPCCGAGRGKLSSKSTLSTPSTLRSVCGIPLRFACLVHAQGRDMGVVLPLRCHLLLK